MQPQAFQAGYIPHFILVLCTLLTIAACNWERLLGGAENAAVQDIVFCKDVYLQRYVPQDKVGAEELLKKILESYGSH